MSARAAVIYRPPNHLQQAATLVARYSLDRTGACRHCSLMPKDCNCIFGELRAAVAASEAKGWQEQGVGCYWINPQYPSAVVSTSVRYLPGGVRQSGYVARVNFAELGLFATRELAQRAVEAYLGVE